MFMFEFMREDASAWIRVRRRKSRRLCLDSRERMAVFGFMQEDANLVFGFVRKDVNQEVLMFEFVREDANQEGSVWIRAEGSQLEMIFAPLFGDCIQVLADGAVT